MALVAWIQPAIAAVICHVLFAAVSEGIHPSQGDTAGQLGLGAIAISFALTKYFRLFITSPLHWSNVKQIARHAASGKSLLLEQ